MTNPHISTVAPAGRARRAIAMSAAALACAAALALGAAMPAEATGMKSVTGNIRCTAFPNVAVGTSATARGTVEFQLNSLNNAGTLSYVSLGYSAAYANWGWKFWTGQAGNFYAYGFGSSGNVTAASRWCMNING